jgi:predicted nucleotidyltransferase
MKQNYGRLSFMALIFTQEDREALKELAQIIREIKPFVENLRLKKALKANQKEIDQLREA